MAVDELPVIDQYAEEKHQELVALLEANSTDMLTTTDGKAAKSIPEVVRKRREIAMPYWNSGWTNSEVAEKVNEWLASKGFPVVSLHTIREDHEAILVEWEADYDRSSYQNRMSHISTLNRIKSEAMRSYEMLREAGKQGGGSAANYLKIALQAEEAAAALDGSKKRAELRAENEAMLDGENTITRVYVGVNLDKV